MLQAEDELALGSEARMNRPRVADGQWRWQLAPGALTADLAAACARRPLRRGRLPVA